MSGPFPIRTAIVPAAGLGTRLYPLTLGTAKELLPLGRYPAIVSTLLEAAAADLKRLIFVVSREKEGLHRFLQRFEMLQAFEVLIVEQPHPAGVLDALWRGQLENANRDDSPTAVLFPDLVHVPDQSALRQLCSAQAQCGAALFGLHVAGPTQKLALTAAVTLHEPLQTPQALALAQQSGRPLRIAKIGPATGAAFEILTTFGQIQTPAFEAGVYARCRPSLHEPLSDALFLSALNDLAAAGELYGVLLTGEVLDLGTLPGYQDAATRFLSGRATLRGLS